MITLPCVCVSCVFSSFLNVCVNAVAVWHLHRCYLMKSCLFSSLSFSSFLSLPSFPAGKMQRGVLSLQMTGRSSRPQKWTIAEVGTSKTSRVTQLLTGSVSSGAIVLLSKGCVCTFLRFWGSDWVCWLVCGGCSSSSSGTKLYCSPAWEKQSFAKWPYNTNIHTTHYLWIKHCHNRCSGITLNVSPFTEKY